MWLGFRAFEVSIYKQDETWKKIDKYQFGFSSTFCNYWWRKWRQSTLYNQVDNPLAHGLSRQILNYTRLGRARLTVLKTSQSNFKMMMGNLQHSKRQQTALVVKTCVACVLCITRKDGSGIVAVKHVVVFNKVIQGNVDVRLLQQLLLHHG